MKEKPRKSGTGETVRELAGTIDAPAIQSLMDDFHELCPIPMSIIDLEGRVLVGVGWQDVCTRFHRVHPETSAHCIESDTQLSAGVGPGEYRLYKCKNNLWDVATPIMIGGSHVGNVFSGQFFFEDERVDYGLFRAQARRYGFDEEEYVAALHAVPRLSRKSLDTGMSFFVKLARMLSQLSCANIRLARAEERLQRENREISLENRIVSAFVREKGEDMHDKALNIVLEELESRDGVFGYIDERGDLVCPTLSRMFDRCEMEDQDIRFRREEWKGFWGRALLEKKTFYSNNPATVPPGHVAIRRNIATPIIFQGAVIGLLHLANKDADYTEKDRETIEAISNRIAPILYGWIQKELREKERSDFLAMVTHDLKSPLSAMMGCADLIMCKCADEDVRATASLINASGSKLMGMVEDFVTISRAEAGKMVLHTSPRDIGGMLAGMRDEFEPVAEKKGLTFTVDVCEHLPRVRVDKKHFERVIGNLVENAFNYTPRGGTVRLKGEALDGHVVVSVSDDGAGVPPEDHDRIFDKYYRSPKVSGIKGTGLGLAIVKAVTEAHGGRAELTSELGKGSTFRIVLPGTRE